MLYSKYPFLIASLIALIFLGKTLAIFQAKENIKIFITKSIIFFKNFLQKSYKYSTQASLYISNSKTKVSKEIEKQLPSMFDAIADALRAGYSLQQSLGIINSEIEEPLKHSLQKIFLKMEYNISLKETLKVFEEEIPLEDVKLFVNAILLQEKIGGNLAIALNHISHSVRERLKIERDLKSYTSQGKLSGIIMVALAPLSMLIFQKLSPGYISPMFETNLGLFLLIIALILEIIGFFWIKKILKFKIF
ncbi:hypothetical protein A2335_02200 [Candidatus Peregrinibacteria bacterium RIFOXYB2_FULL_32_7]|nr:MAG: hypothetical protein A2335_02200 [Candidatus Peregrinibacteria bacterium RIFOXYB2_FULL_32_7]